MIIHTGGEIAYCSEGHKEVQMEFRGDDGNIGEFYCPKCKETYYMEMDYSMSEDDPEDDEAIDVYDAALIWMSHGMDENYDFGYTEEELRNALK